MLARCPTARTTSSSYSSPPAGVCSRAAADASLTLAPAVHELAWDWHDWDRLAAGTVAGLSLAGAVPALASSGSQPRPIPGGFDETFTPVPKNPFVHVLPPAIGFEMATITDFHGVVVAGEVQGNAHGSDGSTYTFDCDIGNGTEDAGIYDDPPEKRQAAMRFAVNIATYAVTH